MTTATEEIKSVETLEAQITASKAELAQLQSTAMTTVQEIMSDVANRPDWTEQLRLASIPASNKEKEIARLETELGKKRSESRWEASQAIRQPVIDTLKSIFIDNPPTVSMSGVRGSIKVVDGKPVVELTATFKALDMASISELVASEVDVKAFMGAELTNLAVNITDIGGENKINIVPSGEGLKGTKVATGITRSKPRLYLINGEYISGKAFLQHLIDTKDTDAMTRIQRYSSAASTGNNVFALAIEAANRLGVEWKEKGAD